MSSNLTKSSKEWTADPGGYSQQVNRRGRTGLARLNDDGDDEFVAIFTTMSPELGSIPSTLRHELRSRYSVHNFTDKSNPFISNGNSMVAVYKSAAEDVVETIERRGYECEYRDDVSQFKFVPRPTVGEIVIHAVRK